MKFLRMIPLITLAVALCAVLMPSTSQAAIVDRVEVTQPEHDGIRGIDSTIVATVTFRSGTQNLDDLAVLAWLVEGPDADLLPDPSATAAVRQAVFAALYPTVEAPGWSDPVFAAVMPLDDIDGATADRNLVSVEVSTPVPVAFGYRHEVRFVLKLHHELDEHDDVRLHVSVWDAERAAAPGFNGYSETPGPGRQPGSNELLTFTVDCNRPVLIEGPEWQEITQNDWFPIKVDDAYPAVSDERVWIAELREVSGFDAGTLPVMGHGARAHIGYRLRAARDPVLAGDLTVIPYLYQEWGDGGEGNYVHVRLGAFDEETTIEWEERIKIQFDANDPGQAPLKRNLSADIKEPAELAVYLADRAGNLSGDDKDAADPLPLTGSLGFVVDLKAPDLLAADTEDDPVVLPEDGGYLTDGASVKRINPADLSQIMHA